MHMNFVGDPIVLLGPVDIQSYMSRLFPKMGRYSIYYNLKNNILKKLAMNSLR